MRRRRESRDTRHGASHSIRNRINDVAGVVAGLVHKVCCLPPSAFYGILSLIAKTFGLRLQVVTGILQVFAAGAAHAGQA